MTFCLACSYFAEALFTTFITASPGLELHNCYASCFSTVGIEEFRLSYR